MKLNVRVVPERLPRRDCRAGPLAGKSGSRPAVDGAANERLVEFLAETFDVLKSAVRIVSGHASRSKTVEVDERQSRH